MGNNRCPEPLVSTEGPFTSLDLNSQLSTLSPILLSYSYAALEPFRFAKSRGWKTLLPQIDPGPEEERIVAEEVARVPELAGEWQPAPADYRVSWREECDLADRISLIPNGRGKV